jgi:hypothetical protein
LSAVCRPQHLAVIRHGCFRAIFVACYGDLNDVPRILARVIASKRDVVLHGQGRSGEYSCSCQETKEEGVEWEPYLRMPVTGYKRNLEQLRLKCRNLRPQT